MKWVSLAEIGSAGLIAAGIGVLWLAVEHRRIGKVTHHWHLAHPEVHRQHPSS